MTDDSEKYCLVGISFNEVVQYHDCQELTNYALIKKKTLFPLANVY